MACIFITEYSELVAQLLSGSFFLSGAELMTHYELLGLDELVATLVAYLGVSSVVG